MADRQFKVGLDAPSVKVNGTAVSLTDHTHSSATHASTHLSGGSDPLTDTFGRMYVQATDLSKSSNAAFQSTDLSFSVAASTKYIVTGTLFVTSNSGPDFKFQFTGPASPTTVLYGAGDASGFGDNCAQAFSTTQTINFSASSGASLGVLPVALYLSNGSNAGTVTLQWAQNTATSTTVFKAGSFIVVYKV